MRHRTTHARPSIAEFCLRGSRAARRHAKALEAWSGVDAGKLLPVPDISNKRIPEAKKHEANGVTR
jgi:Mn-containing catalase